MQILKMIGMMMKMIVTIYFSGVIPYGKVNWVESARIKYALFQMFIVIQERGVGKVV